MLPFLPGSYVISSYVQDWHSINVEALGRVELRAPIVIRLDGTNAEEGRRILAEAGIPESRLRSEATMLDAARAAVALAGQN